MEDAQTEFSKEVADTPMSPPANQIIGNVTAKPLSSKEDIKNELRDQLTSRVRWNETISYLISNQIDTYFEIGTGKVLGGLQKRIDRDARTFPVGKPEDLEILNSNN
jgi:[acyl-carrier-protein] S-malonyltransferase